VIVITRGGGSMEDLWGFNSEPLARSIAGCRIPVVSAIGHEIDFTIADFAASLRAPTPSAAAELIAPELAGILQKLDADYNRLNRAWEYNYLQKLCRIERCSASKVFHEPEFLLRNYVQRVDDMADALERAWLEQKQIRQNRLLLAETKLDSFDPQHVLQRGYAMLIKENRKVADSVSKVSSGEKLTARLADGLVKVTVD
jgi:exodeoxyribonuclease VII large subunit